MAIPLEIIDSHCHYWEPERPDRPYDKGGVDLGAPLSVEQLLHDAAAAGVTKIVQVTPTIMGYDNRYTIEAAQRFPESIAGVFCRFDPTDRAMGVQLAELTSRPEVLGIRITAMKAPFTDWFDDGTLDALMPEAARLSIPVAIFAPNRPRELVSLGRRHPETRILVDHMALLREDPAPFAHWDDVLGLADLPNVYVKISYFPEVAHEPYPFARVQPYVKQMVERFGPDRLIWGSNFPPSKSVCTYKENVDFMLEACDFLSEFELEKIMGGTFRKAVGMEPVHHAPKAEHIKAGRMKNA